MMTQLSMILILIFSMDHLGSGGKLSHPYQVRQAVGIPMFHNVLQPDLP